MIRRGQGLLETIFAIGIMMIALSAILALTASNATGQKESESQVIANNLAREGIEVIRSQRDANWLAKAEWDAGISAGVLAVHFNPATVQWDIVSASSAEPLYLSENGVYISTQTNRASGYSRLITTQSVCVPAESAAGAERVGDTCSDTEKKIGMVVRSAVSWNDRGRNRSTELTDILYAWK